MTLDNILSKWRVKYHDYFGMIAIGLVGARFDRGRFQEMLDARWRSVLLIRFFSALLVIGFFALNLSNLAVQAEMEKHALVTVSAVPQSKLKAVQGRILVDAPPHVVWDTLTDYSEWKKRMPGYEQCRVLKSATLGKMLDVSMKVAPWLPACQYQVQVQETGNSQVTFNRVSGDFDALTAMYHLLPQSNGLQTWLTYKLYIDIGDPLPGLSMVLKMNAEKTLTALKQQSEQEAHQRAIGHR